MTITVGTDTYLSVADADTYWSNRNNSVWAAASTADKEAALREATLYIDGAYQFIGQITLEDQPLAWPRASALIGRGNFKGKLYDIDEIPLSLKNATAELALEALSERLRPAQERGGAVKSEEVDVIKVEYLDFAPSYKTFKFVDMIIRPLTVNHGHIKLVR